MKHFAAIFSILALIMAFGPVSAILLADELSTASTQATVVAPGGLVPREQAALQRQYQFQVRKKGVLLSPNISGASGYPAAPSAVQEQYEEEKLHRYFGIAINLYKGGRLEEAAEILRYILIKDPEDDYTKAYLARVQKAIEKNKKEFKNESRAEAARTKKNKIDNLVKDGIAYYRNKDFDKSLLKFADALALDPDNSSARRYMGELKKFYSREVRIDNIVQEWETAHPQAEKEAGASSALQAGTVKEKAEKLLDKEKGASGEIDKKAGAMLDGVEAREGYDIVKSAEKLLDDKGMEGLLLEKRAANILDDTELGDRIKEIIDAKGLEDKKSMEFTLGPGDMVQISVRDHPELSGKAPVELSGDIILPLVNDTVMAMGLTSDELTEKVKEVLKKYVQDPDVNISILEYKSKMFYVLDEESCTPYPITRAYLTLRDALFISDWGNNRALGRVLVIKPSKRHPIVKKVDAFDLIFRGNLENDMRIEDGDVIYVPMTIVAKVTKTVFDTTAPFRAIRNARDEFLNLKWNQKDWRRAAAVPKIYEQEAMDAQDLSLNSANITTLVARSNG